MTRRQRAHWQLNMHGRQGPFKVRGYIRLYGPPFRPQSCYTSPLEGLAGSQLGVQWQTYPQSVNRRGLGVSRRLPLNKFWDLSCSVLGRKYVSRLVKASWANIILHLNFPDLPQIYLGLLAQYITIENCQAGCIYFECKVLGLIIFSASLCLRVFMLTWWANCARGC